MFDLSDEMIAAMEDDGWELGAVVRHIGRQHPGQTEYVFEREVDDETSTGPRRMDQYGEDTSPHDSPMLRRQSARPRSWPSGYLTPPVAPFLHLPGG